jgi:DegV family protein with EDD domain
MNNKEQINFITPDIYLNMLKSGAQRVISKESILNDLNVFPVVDHDTGSNIAALMRPILAASYSTEDFTCLLKQISNTSLLGASGNSGMIFSAFFTGLASKEAPIVNNKMSINEFIVCLRDAVMHAYQAVAEPIEGTILTIMSSWLAACETVAVNTNDFIVLFDETISITEIALKKTKHQLLILEKKNVVDAGALGFLEFISGMHDYLKTQKIAEYTIDNSINDNNLIFNHSHSIEDIPNYDYCTETLLSYTDSNLHNMKANLAECGDCLVINRSSGYLKVHLHTDKPLAITNLLKKYGQIQHQKIESMNLQWQIAQNRKNKIALVMDSSADMPSVKIKNEQIHVLPLQIRLGAHTLLDRLTVNLNELYQEIHENNTRAQTAAPSPEAIKRYLSYLVENYDSVIVITLSSQLSSTYQAIASVASTMTKKKIEVIDSRRNSAAQGLLVMMASKWISEGDEHNVVVNKILNAIEDTHIFVAVDEFKTMTKSGRAPHVIGLLASWSRFKPIVSLNKNGKPSFAGFAMSKKRCWEKIAKKLITIKKSPGINSLGIVYTSCQKLAVEFATFIETKTGLKIDFITETSCAIGLHAGKGCVGVAISRESFL